MRGKKWIVVFTMGCLLGMGVPLQAQHLHLPKGKKGKHASHLRVRPDVVSSSRPIVSSVTPSAGTASLSLKKESSLPDPVAAKQTLESGASFSASPEKTDVLLQQIRLQIAQLEQTAMASLPQRHPFMRSTFQAHDFSTHSVDTYSGGLFTWNGEIYGVVAAHVIGGMERAEPQLGRLFLADMYYQGRYISVPAQAEIINPMLDIVLVRFLWDKVSVPGFDVKELNPLELTDELPPVGSEVSSHGFIEDHEVADISGRRVVQSGLLSLRTTLPWARVFRPGLCGSWLTDQAGRAVGVHIGSSGKAADERDDIGYATPAWVLRVMVEAYQNGGEGYFPLVVDGHKLADLRANEFVSFVTLYDKHRKVLWKGKGRARFSEDFFTNLFQTYHPHTVQLVLGRVDWLEPSSSILREKISVRKVQYQFPEEPTK